MASSNTTHAASKPQWYVCFEFDDDMNVVVAAQGEGPLEVCLVAWNAVRAKAIEQGYEARRVAEVRMVRSDELLEPEGDHLCEDCKDELDGD